MIRYCRYCGKKLVVDRNLDVHCPLWWRSWRGSADDRHDHWYNWSRHRPVIENAYDRETGKEIT